MSEIFDDLESNDREAVENAKRKLLDQFHLAKDSWLLNGLYDYYLSTNSVRSMEILVNLNEPHYKYLFDRLSESLRRHETEMKVKALTLLGHIVRSQPTWIYKIRDHYILKDIFNLLKNDDDILPLLSALLLLIVLIPLLRCSVGELLYEVFEIFSRLASWNCSASVVAQEQMVHLQIALYALFLRLYGMYPCNFLTYLRTHYRDRNRPVFTHTIKPMLDTVKMHSALVTASKDSETAAERWKSMGVDEVIVECEQYSLDVTERCSHESCYISTSGFRSRSGTTNSTIEKYPLENLKNLSKATTDEKEFFSPSLCFQAQTPPITESSAPTNIIHPIVQNVGQICTQEGTSPPEAAIEATPETTPVRDLNATPLRSPHLNSNVVRSLSSFGSKNRSGSSNNTPNHSQPSSPMRKDASPFTFPENRSSSAFITMKRGDSYSNTRLQKLMHDRHQVEDSNDIPRSSFSHIVPNSPSKFISIDAISRGSHFHRNESPVSQEDEEVHSIVGHQERRIQALRQCDSVLHESNDSCEEHFDNEQEHGSPCTAGGLHMPNSKSMNAFVTRVRRLRVHSQCNTEHENTESSTGSSPGNNCTQFVNSTTVRRASSCPEMKKSPISTKESLPKPPKETLKEETDLDDQINEKNDDLHSTKPYSENKGLITIATQTENFFPMPYEHLFLIIFPTLGNSEVKPSPSPSPAPFKLNFEKVNRPLSYEILDGYIDTATRNETSNLKMQLQLIRQQLYFESYRRETHAYRNRRLLADAKNTRALDEYNSALRDQVQLQQKDIDNLKSEIDTLRQEKMCADKKYSEAIKYWEEKYKQMQDEFRAREENNEFLKKEVNGIKEKYAIVDEQRQIAEASLLDALAEVNVAREQAGNGEKGRSELERLNKEILLFGELQLKYQERLNEYSNSKKLVEEMDILSSTYKEELREHHQQLDLRTSNLEASRSRIGELEHLIIQKDEIISIQKRTLVGVNEKCDEKIKAVESKYQTQIAINRSMEEKMLELWQRIDLPGTRNVHSPETSSCHEAAATDRGSTTTGLSPHSSPLSVSLASSEGSVAFLNSEIKDIKNLQALVDRKIMMPTEEVPESLNEGEVMHQSTSSNNND